MLFKHNAPRLHRIPKQRWRVTKWPAYEAGLQERGDLTIWLDEAALSGWNARCRTRRVAVSRSTPIPRSSNAAIELVLMLRLIFHLVLRQVEGFARSVPRLFGLDLSVPDHATVNRRGRAFAGCQPRVAEHDWLVHVVLDSTGLQMFGQGEWDGEKHRRTSRRWRKLHLAVDFETGEILAHVLTDPDVGDITAVPSLPATAEGPLASVIADRAYDGASVHQATSLRQRDPPPDIIISPRASSVVSNNKVAASTVPDRHVQNNVKKGHMARQKNTGYGRRSPVDTAIGCYKHSIGPKLRAKSTDGQQREVAIAVNALNGMIRTAKPVSVRQN